MTSFFKGVRPSLFLLVLLQEEHQILCYMQPLPYTKTEYISQKLNSSPKFLTSLFSTRKNGGDSFKLDDTRSDEIYIQNKNARGKIEFSNFWGTKITSNDEIQTAETTDPRQIPFVPTLDVSDGPLPPGAYIKEGKSEFDSKSTCRILIDVKTNNVDTTHGSDTVVRHLQSCIDAGFDTFQLHDQTPMSLSLVKRMNENTPSYINKHWSIKLQIQPILSDVINFSTKTALRQSVFDLIEETGSDALDSLKLDFGNLQPISSIALKDVVLETFDHLVGLQREGWIRSIGIQDLNSQKLRYDVRTHFDNFIDFEEQEGNLLLPPFSSNLQTPNDNIRVANALAGGLLTNRYCDINEGGKLGERISPNTGPLLANESVQLLIDWAKRRGTDQKSKSDSVPVWKQYQENVLGQLNWIAMKHDVSITAVALRWTLECGNNAIDTNEEGPIISSALTDITLDDREDDICNETRELRQVFRFRLDEEDRQILFDLSASQDDKSNERQSQDIDFNNPALWL